MRLLAATALGAALVLPPLTGFHPYYLYLSAMALLWGSLASAWSLLAFAGQISFGHAVYFGAGAYASALLAQRAGWNPWVGVGAAALVGGLVALPIGLAAHRLGGAYLALATLAYAEGGRLVALNWTGLTGGGAGLVGIPPLPVLGGGADPARDRAAGYYLALALLVLVLALSAALRRSRVGLAWAAIREREQRAQLLGVPATAYKVLAFVCSGTLTAAAGALYVHAVRVVEPDLVFGRGLSILPLVMATFGGVHALLGPPLGALVLYLGSELLLQPTLPRLHELPYAVALVLVVLLLPRGLAGRRAARDAGPAHA